MEPLDDLKKLKLARDENEEYTLNHDRLNDFFGIQEGLTLTPDKDKIELFAAINYLFGIFGVNVSSFAAIPAGFIASYSKDNKFYGTFFTYEDYVKKELIKLCDEEQEHKISFQVIKRILERDDLSLTDKALKISEYISLYSKRNADYNVLDRIAVAKKAFSDANNTNCNVNDRIICRIIDRELADYIYAVCKKGVPIDSIDQGIRERVLEGANKFGEIMKDQVYPGFYTYIGEIKELVKKEEEKQEDKEKVEQDFQILNNLERIEEMKTTLGYNDRDYEESKKGLLNIIKLLNICSTDYSADVAEVIFEIIISAGEKMDTKNPKEMIKTGIPETIDNLEQKHRTRHELYPFRIDNQEVVNKM